MAVSLDPLSRLVVNEASVDRELLAKVLEKKIRLDLSQGIIRLPSWCARPPE